MWSEVEDAGYLRVFITSLLLEFKIFEVVRRSLYFLLFRSQIRFLLEHFVFEILESIRREYGRRKNMKTILKGGLSFPSNSPAFRYNRS